MAAANMSEKQEMIAKELVALLKVKKVAMLEAVGYGQNENMSEDERDEAIRAAHAAEDKAETEMYAMAKMANILGHNVSIVLNPIADAEPGIFIDGVRCWHKPFDEDAVVDEARNYNQSSSVSVFELSGMGK